MTETTVPRRALLLLLILTIVWGTNWPLFPLAVREVSVWTFRAVSVIGAGSALMFVAWMRGEKLTIDRRYWPTVLMASMCYLVVWNIASTWSATVIASGQSAVLGFTMPLWAALISWAVLGEKPTGRLLLAILLGACAVVLLIIPGLADYADAPIGFAIGLLAGFGWAVGTLILKRGQVQATALVLTSWQMLLAAVPITIAAFALGDGAELAVDSDYRLHHACAHERWQFLLVFHCRSTARQPGRSVLDHGAHRGHDFRCDRAWRAARTHAMAGHVWLYKR